MSQQAITVATLTNLEHHAEAVRLTVTSRDVSGELKAGDKVTFKTHAGETLQADLIEIKGRGRRNSAYTNFEITVQSA